jgi:predicted nucleotidyltransferase
METRTNQQTPLVGTIRSVLAADPRVVFAYLYGSYLEDPEKARDVDLAVYSTAEADPLILAADLKIALYQATQTPADRFDVRVINDLVVKGDLFALLFLKNLLEKGILLVDRDREVKGEFLEAYGLKYRSCAGLIGEILA